MATVPESYTTMLFSAIGGLLAVILGLVGYTAQGFKKTQESQQEELDEGVKEFTALKLKCLQLDKDIKFQVEHFQGLLLARDRDCVAMRKWVIAIEESIDILEAKVTELENFKLTITIHHEKQHGEKIT